MNNFRLVVMDYPKQQMDSTECQRTLTDLIFVKQRNFERTDPNYVVLDKHDMIGTHFMVYETQNLYAPRLVFAIRVTFEQRAQRHKLKTPIQDLVPHMPATHRTAYEKFRKERGPLADCNSWFVDPGFSQKNSGLSLSDIGYLMVFLHVTRMGHDHILGCTNERYKASRWLEKIGQFEKGFEFSHPVVPDPHLFIMVEKFREDYLKTVFLEHRPLFENLMEILPADFSGPSLAQHAHDVFKLGQDQASVTKLAV